MNNYSDTLHNIETVIKLEGQKLEKTKSIMFLWLKVVMLFNCGCSRSAQLF